MQSTEITMNKPFSEAELLRNIGAIAATANKLGLEGREVLAVELGTLAKDHLKSVVTLKHQKQQKPNGRIIS